MLEHPPRYETALLLYHCNRYLREDQLYAQSLKLAQKASEIRHDAKTYLLLAKLKFKTVGDAARKEILHLLANTNLHYHLHVHRFKFIKQSLNGVVSSSVLSSRVRVH